MGIYTHLRWNCPFTRTASIKNKCKPNGIWATSPHLLCDQNINTNIVDVWRANRDNNMATTVHHWSLYLRKQDVFCTKEWDRWNENYCNKINKQHFTFICCMDLFILVSSFCYWAQIKYNPISSLCQHSCLLICRTKNWYLIYYNDRLGTIFRILSLIYIVPFILVYFPFIS